MVLVHSSPMSRPLLLGHRGARRYAPENTIEAFDLALAHGCDGFEFDVRRTRDARSVICHDPRIHHHAVAEVSYADLQAATSSLTCLEEVLARYAAGVFLDIELKVPRLEEAVIRALRQSKPPGCVVSSFFSEVLDQLRARDPLLPRGYIFDQGEGLMRWAALDLAYVIPHHSLVSRELVDDVHAAGRKILVWTVNQEREMLQFAQWGVDGIVSDDTRLLCATLGARRDLG